MKKIILLLTIISILSCNSRKKPTIIGETEYQQKQNAIFKDGSKSPLKKNDLRDFSGLDFFPVDSTYIVKAKLVKTENAKIFEMPTTTYRKPLYKEYGILYFTIQEKELELTIYQSQDEAEDEKYKDVLFLPFTDSTSGIESYGGGRYMDILTSNEQKDGTVLLNFNNTYNPYCTYNENISCPLTPRKNHLDIAINAGIKDFKK